MGAFSNTWGQGMGHKWTLLNLKEPTSLTATMVSDVRIDLAFTVNDTNQDGSRIYISTDGITYTEKGTVSGSTATYQATELTAFTLYYFKVVAYKGTKESAHSNIASDITNYPSVINTDTLAWYDSQQLDSLVKDEAGLVYIWNDKLAGGTVTRLVQATNAKKPTWTSNGILFNGTSNSMLTGAMTYPQPSFIYMLVRVISWEILDTLFDGGAFAKGFLMESTASPKLSVNAGTYSAESSDLVLGDWTVLRVYFNGANSKFIVNDNAPITGNFGANVMNGFTLGASRGDIRFANMEVDQVILRSSDVGEADIYSYLKKKSEMNMSQFLQKYYTETMNDYNQLNVVMAGDSIFGRMNATEISYTPGQETGNYPPNMWQQLVAYKVLQDLQYADSDVNYNNLAAWTKSTGWGLDKTVIDNIRIWQTDALNEYAEITITGASFLKMLYYTDTVAANQITITANGVAPSTLGISGGDTFTTQQNTAMSNLYKWANVVWSGLDPNETYVIRITNTGGGTSQIWGCESWSNKRINVIVSAHGGYTAYLHKYHLQNFYGTMYDPDLIIHELPCLNDSFQPKSKGGKSPSDAAVSAVQYDFIYALSSGTFTNYSGLTLAAGDYAEFDGTNWIAGSSIITTLLANYESYITYIDSIINQNISTLFIIPHKITVESQRPWLTVMKSKLRSKMRALGALYIDMDSISSTWNTSTGLSDGTHLNDISVGHYFDEITKQF